MKLIVGLGNPGDEYAKTKHNIGFMVIDQLVKDLDLKLDQTKFNNIFFKGLIDKEKVIILKPQTYMNLSGEAVKKIIDYYDIDLDDVLIVYDDKDLPIGKIRVRQKGSAGSHNGMISILQHLKTNDVPRMRIGIDQKQTATLKDYVLKPFSKTQQPIINKAIKKASKACIDFIKHDTEYIMNNYNSK
jgi:peptidyl-tRNA hydrolase, PTH1 family